MKVFAAVILAVTCLPFLGVGVWEFVRNRRELNDYGRAVGIVTGNAYFTDSHDGIVSGAYYPTVEFVTETGARTRFTDGIGSLPADYETGARVEVVFEREKPQNARVYSWKRFWLAPSILVLVGVLPIAIFFFVTRRL